MKKKLSLIAFVLALNVIVATPTEKCHSNGKIYTVTNGIVTDSVTVYKAVSDAKSLQEKENIYKIIKQNCK